MRITYLDYLPDEHRDAAVDMFLKLLHEKFVPLLGNGDKARHILSEGINPAQCITAIADDTLAGVLAVQEGRDSLMNPGLGSVIRAYGVFSGMFRMAGLILLYHDTMPGEAYVDGVAVADGFRGKGIGTGLLAALEERAMGKGMETITLEVIDSNPRAEALYRRLGFRTVSTAKLWPFNRIFGFPFKASLLMEKPLSRKP